MLKEMDIRWLPTGHRYVFSVKFVSMAGKVYFFPMAYVCGLPYNVRKARQRGIQPVDSWGNKTGHVYPVGIDNFTMYNQMEVIL